jgi:hypothetical protein
MNILKKGVLPTILLAVVLLVSTMAIISPVHASAVTVESGSANTLWVRFLVMEHHFPVYYGEDPVVAIWTGEKTWTTMEYPDSSVRGTITYSGTVSIYNAIETNPNDSDWIPIIAYTNPDNIQVDCWINIATPLGVDKVFFGQTRFYDKGGDAVVRHGNHGHWIASADNELLESFHSHWTVSGIFQSTLQVQEGEGIIRRVVFTTPPFREIAELPRE